MIPDLDTLKDLAVWARKQQIQQLTVGDINIVFSPLAMVPEEIEILEKPVAVLPGAAAAISTTAPKDDPDLFYSVR